MIWYLAIEGLVIAAAVVGTVWLKWAGEREWRAYQARMRWMRLGVKLTQVSAAVAAMGPVMAKAVKAASDFERAMNQANATIRVARPTGLRELEAFTARMRAGSQVADQATFVRFKGDGA